MSQIYVNNLTFSYDGSCENVFDHVSFQLDTDWKLGFTGRNGRGKTTFLRLLAGQLSYSGTITSAVDFDYFPFDVPDPAAMTMDICEGIHPEVQYWQLVRELNLMDAAEDILWQPFTTLSGGERTKALLSVLFLKENHFLLIDEPTNHLDLDARKAVSAYLKRKKGFILVSHDREFLDGCIDHILSINKTNIEIQQGTFSTWYYNKTLRDQFEAAENEKLQKSIKALEAAERRSATWSDKVEKTKNGVRNSGIKPDKGHIGAQAAKMMKRSKAVQKRRLHAMDEKEKLLKNTEQADALKLYPLTYRADTLLTVQDLSITYGQREILDGLTFSVRAGQRIALKGPNGCGKSSILKLICGENISHQGTLHTGNGLKISYVPQDASYLSGSLQDLARQRGIDLTQFLTILRKLDFSRAQFEKTMETYSGGQKKKVLLAASLCEEAHLYVWDEPLNYVDILSRIQIENLLANYHPTMIFVEHDGAFCAAVATEVLQL
ncbi:ribosomal protection-like ABC-F family protein [Ihubacter sp. rT4E-8]|uniref:ribosomal protection-like ABC-F family protein n=1 Tax=unclassified Ihubacter TaxID=2633299 RepID=UPI003C7DA5F5